MKTAIGYLRVSRPRQGRSGLGLEAQRFAVESFCGVYGFKLLGFFTDVESGQYDDRPELEAALAVCRAQDATLLVATFDRLTRSVGFIVRLIESKAQFMLVDDPHADEFNLHMKAAYAQKERKDISKRTKAALAIAKARGVQLGRYGKEVLSKLNRERSYLFAWAMRPIIEKIIAQGHTTIRAITKALNRRKVPTYRGKGRWHIKTVHNMLRRMNEQRI